jgi:hypothetical protein
VNRQRNLPLESKPALGHLSSKTMLIRRLKQSRANMAMDFG